MRLAPGFHFTFGSAWDLVWTDFNNEGTETFLLWGLRAGIELRF